MDIKTGIHLNGWRERTCRTKEAGTNLPFRDRKERTRKQLQTGSSQRDIPDTELGEPKREINGFPQEMTRDEFGFL
jgi:hypothetical protein